MEFNIHATSFGNLSIPAINNFLQQSQPQQTQKNDTQFQETQTIQGNPNNQAFIQGSPGG